MSFELRPYQSDSIESLREGFKQGHKRQVLAASTGAGKSLMSLSILDSARKKGSKVMFVCDRRVLVDQFSRHLDKHGIDHGCYMAGHWRHRPYESVQVASIQTIERMGSWPAVDLVIVDEIHACMRKSLKDFMTNNPDIKVLGLTATPFHAEMGKYFTSVTNVITMDQLVQDGFLVPFRVFVATEVDTKGVKVLNTGEWQQEEIEKRSLSIVGDVVADYVRISEEVFGGPRKTICFSAGVAHGTELVNRFAEVGINAVQISYKDDEEFKKQVLEDFAKPDTDIKIVVSSDILTRGFDQTDVEHVIIAKPLRKAFSMHVQMVGRGARMHPGKSFCIIQDNCIASGSRVLTARGLVEIENVLLSDKIWDGHNFVAHKGVISRGKRPTITYAGLTATRDHLVKTATSWETFGRCSDEQIAIVRTGFGGEAVRECDHYFSTDSSIGAEGSTPSSRFVRVPAVRLESHNFSEQPFVRGDEGVQGVQSNREAQADLPGLAEGESSLNEVSLRKRISYKLLQLRDAWDSIRVRISKSWGNMDHGKSWHSGELQRHGVGQSGQQWKLPSWKLEVGNSSEERIESQEQHWGDGKNAPFYAGKPDCEIRGRDTSIATCLWHELRPNTGEVQQTQRETEREVWDIVDCGPRNSFTCEGLLVHNCGNWLRFQEDWDTIYNEGTKELDSGLDAKTRKEKTDKEKEAAKCPKCKHLWAGGSDTCLHCGNTREKKSMVESLPGEMQELATSGKHSKEDKQAWYSMAQYMIQNHGWSSGRAAHCYKDKFGVFPKGLNSDTIQPSRDFEKFVKSRLIAYLKGKRKGLP